VVHMMNAKTRATFMREVKKYGLSVNEEPLSVFRATKRTFCACNSK
jgi:hypothetical protein